MLGDCAFKDAHDLHEIALSHEITYLGFEQTFMDCVSLEIMHLPSSVSIIPRNAFSNCESLETVFLPDSNKYSIENNVFSNCSSLKTIHTATDDPEDIKISDDAFNNFNIDDCTLYIPAGTRWAYRHHPGFCKFKNIEIERQN